jgi:glucose-1-phosphate adenylyltransferase
LYGPQAASGTVATFVLAGGRGTRLGVLTQERPKPLLPFAGNRLIDFTLSNCVNSGLEHVSVLTQYRAQALMEYLGDGDPWGFNSNGFRLHARTAPTGGTYAGTADAVRHHLDEPAFAQVETVIVLAADHVYEMDYGRLLDHHRRTGADVTLGVVPVPRDQASQFGIVDVDSQGLVRQFQEKPILPSGRLASMGIYVFDVAKLRLLLRAHIQGALAVDFGHDVLPLALRMGMRVAAYEFDGYWRDVGSPEAYLDAHADLLRNPDTAGADVTRWPIRTRPELLGDVEIGDNAIVRRSLVLGGAKVDGVIVGSTLLPGAHVDEGAIVRNSVLMRGVLVERGAVIDNAIIDRGATVRAFSRVGTDRSAAVTVVRARSVVGTGSGSQVRREPRGNRAEIA